MEKASKTEARIHEKSTKNVMRIRTGPRDAPIGTGWAEPAPEGDPGKAGTRHRGARHPPSGSGWAPLPRTPVPVYIYTSVDLSIKLTD